MNEKLKKVLVTIKQVVHIVSFFGSATFRIVVLWAVFTIFQNDPLFLKNIWLWTFCGVCYLVYPLFLGFFKMRGDDE